MATSVFPRSAEDVVATLAEIFEHQKQFETAVLLRSATASIELVDYDNWNGGTSTWALRLEIAASSFAGIEPRLDEIEQEIGKKAGHLSRGYPNDHLSSVVISPKANSAVTSRAQAAPPESDVKGLWPEGRFRMFLSHSSRHKAAMVELKGELSQLGVAAFVAHEDIEPTSEWQHEIELALRSMHALVALVTPDFSDSRWTDQEVGWALGRGTSIIPVHLGVPPYGFAGKVQAVKGDLGKPAALAASLITAVLKKEPTRSLIKQSLVSAFEKSASFAMAKALCLRIIEIDDFTADEIARIKKACRDNGQVKDSFGVVGKIEQKLGQVMPTRNEEGDVPF